MLAQACHGFCFDVKRGVLEGVINIIWLRVDYGTNIVCYFAEERVCLLLLQGMIR